MVKAVAPSADVSIVWDDSANNLNSLPDEGRNKDGSIIAAGSGQPQRVPSGQKPRTYYVDWLRVFLTVIVVVHHCILTYGSSWTAWATRKGDLPLQQLTEFFINANQAWFMTLFFFISGIYVPGSYKRKGTWQFLLDRTIRLMIPCLVYSLVVPPFITWWSETAKGKSVTVGESFQRWFAPGWPTTYVLPTGPPWFLWMLWWFNVAYVVLFHIVALVQKLMAKKQAGEQGTGAAGSERLPITRRLRAREFSLKECLMWGGIFTSACFTLMYSTRVLDFMVWKLRPAQFFTRGPFVAFMPDFFPVYALAFGVGTFSGPSKWDLLPRLPKDWCWWCLCIGGVFWTLCGFLVNVSLGPVADPKTKEGLFFFYWAIRTFVEQSFAVVWSVGILVLFRDNFNVKPTWLGRQIIGGAYGAYLVHMPTLMVFARAFMPLAAMWPTYVIAAVAISLPSVFTSWLIACLLRAIPGADNIL